MFSNRFHALHEPLIYNFCTNVLSTKQTVVNSYGILVHQPVLRFDYWAYNYIIGHNSRTTSNLCAMWPNGKVTLGSPYFITALLHHSIAATLLRLTEASMHWCHSLFKSTIITHYLSKCVKRNLNSKKSPKTQNISKEFCFWHQLNNEVMKSWNIWYAKRIWSSISMFRCTHWLQMDGSGLGFDEIRANTLSTFANLFGLKVLTIKISGICHKNSGFFTFDSLNKHLGWVVTARH